MPPNQVAVVPVRLEGDSDILQHPLLVQTQDRIERETGLMVEDAVICAPQSGLAQIVVRNCSSVTQSVPMRACLERQRLHKCFLCLSQVKVTWIQLTVRL